MLFYFSIYIIETREMSATGNGGIASLILPISEKTFKNFSNARRIAMDIGGSLTKIAYCSSFECKTAKLSEVVF
jgi:pantothenate kinase